MTSASELFYNRRSRAARNADFPSSSSPLAERNPQLLHRHNRLHRHDADFSFPIRRPSHGPPQARHICNRVSHTERESVWLDHSTNQHGQGNSASAEASSSGTSRPRLARNDRLPGAVIQARARLLERLRGVSITGNRQNSRDSGISWDEFVISDDFRVVDTGDWESESREWFEAATTYPDMTIQVEPSSVLPYTSNVKPPGLSHQAINSLQREVFDVADGDGLLRSMQECCICLESFQKGDELIYLPCEHRFHPLCLDPWLQTCGDCPYCRKGIALECGSNFFQN